MINESAFLELIEKMKWGELDIYERIAKANGLINDALLPGLKSERKQVIELLTRLFVEKNMESAIPFLFEVIRFQPDSANAIRARNALIQFGMKAMSESQKYIHDRKWIVRFHTVQIVAMTKQCEVLGVLKSVSELDRSEKVQAVAFQGIEYILGENPLSECFLLPQIDEREFRIGVQDSLF